MASLPPHVSRTPAAAPPHGFSIQSDAFFSYPAALTASADFPILIATDTDFYVEDVWLVSRTAGDITTLTFDLEVWSAGADTAANMQSAAVDSAAMTAMVPLSLGVNQNQLLTDGNVLVLSVTVATGGSLTGTLVQVRYRRKA